MHSSYLRWLEPRGRFAVYALVLQFHPFLCVVNVQKHHRFVCLSNRTVYQGVSFVALFDRIWCLALCQGIWRGVLDFVSYIRDFKLYNTLALERLTIEGRDGSYLVSGGKTQQTFCAVDRTFYGAWHSWTDSSRVVAVFAIKRYPVPCVHHVGTVQ